MTLAKALSERGLELFVFLARRLQCHAAAARPDEEEETPDYER